MGVPQGGLGVLHGGLRPQTWRRDDMAASRWRLVFLGVLRGQLGALQGGLGALHGGLGRQTWRRDKMAASRWCLVFLGVLQGGLEVLHGLEVLQGGLRVLQGGLGVLQGGLGHQTWRWDKMAASRWRLVFLGGFQGALGSSKVGWGSSRVG